MKAVEIRGNKTTGDLTREAFWFVLHTVFAVALLALTLAAFTAARPDAGAAAPKLWCTAAAFFVPAVGGFAAGRTTQGNVARYVWISGLLTFSFVCVYVLNLPTGAGLCEGCGAVDKLFRTFFSIDRGSGLLGGDGVLIGSWVPLSMIGYAVGAKTAGSL